MYVNVDVYVCISGQVLSVAGSMPVSRNRASKFESTMYVNVDIYVCMSRQVLSVAGSMPVARNRASKFESTMDVRSPPPRLRRLPSGSTMYVNVDVYVCNSGQVLSVAGSMPVARNRASKFESTMYVNVGCLRMHEWAGLKRGRLQGIWPKTLRRYKHRGLVTGRSEASRCVAAFGALPAVLDERRCVPTLSSGLTLRWRTCS